MTDFSSVIAYDQTFPVKILRPDTGEETGIVFDMVSAQSKRAVRASKVVEMKRWRSLFDSEDKSLSPEQIVEFSDQTEAEQLIACIASWSWGGHSFGDLGADPECTEENRRYVIEHPNAAWIRAQLSNAAGDLTNFFPNSVSDSAGK